MTPARSDNTKRTRFAERLKALPAKPGVYIMRNERGDVIYVGKAANIRNRVRNYFGTPHSLDLPANRFLAEVLRYDLGLTGTKIGCNEAECGACTVIVNGRSVDSCIYPAFKAQGATVTTIEGLANGQLHPMQQAFWDKHGLQCGFCTPGMIMASVDLLNRTPNPTEEDIRQGLEGNLCRCTGYQNIVAAVQQAASDWKERYG